MRTDANYTCVEADSARRCPSGFAPVGWGDGYNRTSPCHSCRSNVVCEWHLAEANYHAALEPPRMAA
jgi:hypothetical protein